MTPARAFDLAVDALAVARLTTLAVEDSFPPAVAARHRAYLYVQARHGQAWADGLDCTRCVGVWVTGAVTVAGLLAPRAWRPAARALAVAQLAGMLSR